MKIFLIIYLVLFYGLVFLWRSYMTWRKTGVNPYRITKQNGLADFVARIYSFVSVGIIINVLLFSLGPPSWYIFLSPITWLELPLLRTIGTTLLILTLSWVLFSQVNMGNSWRIGIDTENETKLITHGVFRYSRNPIFLGMRVNLLSLFLILPNALSLVLWLLGDISIQMQVFLEEEHLQQAFGPDYKGYCATTPRYFGK